MRQTPTHPLRLLMVEDSEDDAFLLAHELRRSGFALTYQRVDNAKDMQRALENDYWDVITSDHAMPMFSAPAALALARQFSPETPFIIVSGEINLNLAVSLMKAGAHDYIQKRELARVGPSIERELQEMELHQQQKQAEEARRVSEEKFFKAFHNSPDSINLNRLRDGVYLEVNQGFEHYSGYTAAEALGKSTLELNVWANPDDRERLAGKLRRDGKIDNEEVIYRTKGGVLKPGLVSARLITVNGEDCVIVFNRDLSEQKRAEQEIRRQNQELQAVSQIITAVTTQLDVPHILNEALHGALSLLGLPNGAVYRVNPNEYQLSLMAEHQLSDENVTFLRDHPIHLDHWISRQLITLQKSIVLDESLHAQIPAPPNLLPEEAFRYQVIFPLISKNELVGMLYLLNPEPIELPQSSIELAQQMCGAIVLALDNALLYETVQQHAKELEDHVAERTTQLRVVNQELEAFTYSVAHDLRAPLRAIGGYNQILIEDFAGQFTPESEYYLQRIATVVHRSQLLIDNLLELSRLARVEITRQRVNLSALAHEITDELNQRDADRHVEWQIADGLVANGDLNLLRTVLENLLGNAWKFTLHQPQARIEFRTQASPSETIFFVRDNGAGFNPDYTQRLFGPFQRLHSNSEFPGNGIGLASVRRIVQRHGGRVWAEGQVNQGATFYFTLK